MDIFVSFGAYIRLQNYEHLLDQWSNGCSVINTVLGHIITNASYRAVEKIYQELVPECKSPFFGARFWACNTTTKESESAFRFDDRKEGLTETTPIKIMTMTARAVDTCHLSARFILILPHSYFYFRFL